MTPEHNVNVRDLINLAHERGKRKGRYRSPLDADGYLDKQPPVYKNTLQGVLSELERGGSEVLPHHPPRVVSAVIDWNMENPDQASLDTLRLAIGFAIASRLGDTSAPGLLRELSARVNMEHEGMRETVVNQEQDFATWRATDPDRSYGTASVLALATKHREILLIAMAHGAVTAGLDVLLTYRDITETPDSVFHAIRFSKYKRKDEKPRLIEGELEYLREAANGKQVVVFEEDVKTYKTAEAAYEFFQHEVFPGEKVIVAANRKEFSSRKRPYIV